MDNCPKKISEYQIEPEKAFREFFQNYGFPQNEMSLPYSVLSMATFYVKAGAEYLSFQISFHQYSNGTGIIVDSYSHTEQLEEAEKNRLGNQQKLNFLMFLNDICAVTINRFNGPRRNQHERKQSHFI